ncbi:MAG: signal peptide peptidase SppA [bacterium]|nr:signal peptide peptidase SppA [bacterium]
MTIKKSKTREKSQGNLIPINNVWAITQDFLNKLESTADQLNLIAETEEIKSLLLEFEAEEVTPIYSIENGAAIIEIFGPLTKTPSFMSFLFGGSTYPGIKETIRAALIDPEVTRIILNIDSPGGGVDGAKDLSDFIFNSRGKKPIIAYAGGIMASAAYWIGSAADEIFTNETAIIGSIGVLGTHTDFSEMDKKDGVKRTIVAAGKYKDALSDAKPLSKDGRDILEGQVNYLYSIFVEDVARNRGVTVEMVVNNMADGQVFIGRQAVKAGLVNDINSMETIKQTKKSEVKVMAKEQKEVVMTIDILTADHSDLVEQIRAEAIGSVDQEKIKAEAVTAENERIMGLVAINFGKKEADKFAAIVAAGVTVEQFQAIRDVTPTPSNTTLEADDDKKKAEMLEAIKAAGPANPGAGSGKKEAPTDFDAEVDRVMKAENIGKGPAVSKVVETYPELHKAWLSKLPAAETLQ